MFTYSYFNVIILMQHQMIKAQQMESDGLYTVGDGEKKTQSRLQLKKIKEEESDLKFFSWDFKQNYIYITYLKNFRTIFNSHEERKRAKVFTHLSKVLTTRNPHQIKSHHQKMMIRHKSIEVIIEFLRLKIIKHIKANPQYIKDIQQINQYCQAFFIQESGFQNQIQSYVKNRKTKKDPQLANQANIIEVTAVKIEENELAYSYRELKNSQISQGNKDKGQVKVEGSPESNIMLTN